MLHNRVRPICCTVRFLSVDFFRVIVFYRVAVSYRVFVRQCSTRGFALSAALYRRLSVHFCRAAVFPVCWSVSAPQVGSPYLMQCTVFVCSFLPCYHVSPGYSVIYVLMVVSLPGIFSMFYYIGIPISFVLFFSSSVPSYCLLSVFLAHLLDVKYNYPYLLLLHL